MLPTVIKSDGVILGMAQQTEDKNWILFLLTDRYFFNTFEELIAWCEKRHSKITTHDYLGG